MRAEAHEEVVYITGAGFSAQFGLPVMGNFLEKSKDMYSLMGKQSFGNRDIKFFGDIYDEIDKLRRCKDFFASDMTNIEEVLSLFEMGNMMGDNLQNKIDFQSFIADVVNYYTDQNTEKETFVLKALYNFLLRLFHVKSRCNGNVKYNDCAPKYSILTFNYDMLLENTLDYFYKKNYDTPCFALEVIPHSSYELRYIKLHGSADAPETIVAPTWRKSFSENEPNIWKEAGQTLTKANHIRIIGYSLPITDSYLKYF